MSARLAANRISTHQGRRQKNFHGGKQRKKDQNIAKKDRKIALLSLLRWGMGGNGKNAEK